jgi:Holliday junction DNA helicase RuvA
VITFVEGMLVEKQPGRAVMNVHGVGYELAIPLSTFDRLPDENQPCRLLTHFHVREDAQELFGFLTEGERQLFRMLLAVSGIGPKTAMSALSGLPARDFRAAIVGGDIKRLSSISGIGKKTAERMVVELRDKLSAGEALEAVTGGAPATPGDLRQRDAILALVSLGYKQADAQKRVVETAEKLGPAAPVEELIRRSLGRG